MIDVGTSSLDHKVVLLRDWGSHAISTMDFGTSSLNHKICAVEELGLGSHIHAGIWDRISES